MAARLNTRHSELVIKRIRTGALVDRLQKHALGTLRFPTGGAGGSKRGESKPGVMTESQVRAAAFLIERTIARAQAPLNVAMSGDIIVEERDPTQRPADYHRKGKAPM
jgi:hypothetical protein